MAVVLIVGHDGLTAGRMARTLRQAGHTPILAPDARSALQEALDRPDLILLNLWGLPELPGEELLRRLGHHPKTGDIPVIVTAGSAETAGQLRESEMGNVAAILFWPVSGAQFLQAIDTTLADRGEPDPEALQLAQQQQRELIDLLIRDGPDPLVFHVYRRLCAERTRNRASLSSEPLTWPEIADWAKREGLVNAEQARILRRPPPNRPREPVDGST